MKKFKSLLLCLFVMSHLSAQNYLEIVGDSKITNESMALLSILSTGTDENSRIETGSDLTYKAGIAYNGVNDVVILRGKLGEGGLMMNQNGKIGINEVPGDARLFIKQNSTSGYSGFSQLHLEEAFAGGESFIKMKNEGSSDAWGITANAGVVTGKFKLTKFDATQSVDLITLDGDTFRAGIHNTSPEAYLHLKQQFAGIDAMAFEEPASQGSDKWSFRIGDNDILIYFNGGIRGGFDSATGNYNNFPPSSSVPEKNKGRLVQVANICELEPMLFATKRGMTFSYDLSSVSESNSLVTYKNGRPGYLPNEVARATAEAWSKLQNEILQRAEEIENKRQTLLLLEERVTKLEKQTH
ncbi:hypothetical protein [Jiulongibacter sediminis]|nr:hypothetical protein [Jiulongibacter sediminis]